MELIQEIAQHLHNQGIGVLGTNLFWSYLPDSPDNAYAVIDTGGLPQDREATGFKEPTIQIMVRHTSYALGKAKLTAIKNALHRTLESRLTPGGTYFVFIFAISAGGHLGRDENGLDLFSINFQCRTR